MKLARYENSNNNLNCLRYEGEEFLLHFSLTFLPSLMIASSK